MKIFGVNIWRENFGTKESVLKRIQGGSFTGPFIKDVEGYLEGIAERQGNLGVCPYCKKKFTKYDLLSANKMTGVAFYSHQGRCIKKSA